MIFCQFAKLKLPLPLDFQPFNFSCTSCMLRGMKMVCDISGRDFEVSDHEMSLREKFGFGDSNLDDEARDLRRLLEGVQQGFHPGLVEVRKTLRFVEQFPANLGTLRLLNEIDAEHVHTPYFDQLHREVSALRLIKKQEFARYFHERLRKFMEEEYDPKEALSFQCAFFGTERAHGCGLKPEDLPLSPQERMVLNRIRLESKN